MMRKGQAAMEFLMTYGWAILVVLVAIGALAYFGVLSPQKFLPESCTLVPGLGCDDFAVDDSAVTVVLSVRNGMGESIDASGVNIDTNGDGAGDCTALDPAVLNDGQTTPWTVAGCTIGAVGEIFKGDIIGSYTKGSGTLVHGLTGSISARIVA